MAATYSVLPLANFELPFYSFNISLGATRYTLTLRYNSRADRWFMDIADAQRNALVTGIPLLILRRLINQYTTRGLPEGELFATDDSGQLMQPGIRDFLLNHSLRYVQGISG